MRQATLRRWLPLDRQGSVALETAFFIPLLCLIMVGFWETYTYIRAVALVERATFSVGDMMARQNSPLVDCGNTSNSLNLGTYILAAEKVVTPLDLSNNGEVILSGIDNPAGVPTVRWQRRSTYALSGISSAVGQQSGRATLPAGVAPFTTPVGDTLLVAEVFYQFSPFAATQRFWPGAPASVTIKRITYFHARTTALNTLTAGCGGLR